MPMMTRKVLIDTMGAVRGAREMRGKGRQTPFGRGSRTRKVLFGKGGKGGGVVRAGGEEGVGRKCQCLVPIAIGTEEMEAVIVIDTLRRAGADVTVASVEETKEVLASRGVQLTADTLLSEEVTNEDYTMIVLPGGMPGAARLSANKLLTSKLVAHHNEGKSIAAICAAPAVILEPLGLLQGEATCHPAFAESLKASSTCVFVEDCVVEGAGNIITSRGPGTAFPFALTLVKKLFGENKAQEVCEPMVFPSGSMEAFV